MRPYLKVKFLLPVIWNVLLIPVILGTAVMFIAMNGQTQAGSGILYDFYLNSGHIFLGLFRMAIFVSPVMLIICLILSILWRNTEDAPAHRNLPLILTIVVQGLLAAALTAAVILGARGNAGVIP